MNAQAWIAIAGILLGIIVKLAHDIGKLEGEMSAMARVLEKDRREDRRVLAQTAKAKKRFAIF